MIVEHFLHAHFSMHHVENCDIRFLKKPNILRRKVNAVGQEFYCDRSRFPRQKIR